MKAVVMKNETELKRGKKLNAEQIDLAKAEVGFNWKGRFLKFTEGQPFEVADDDGEIRTKKLTFVIYEKLDGSGERFRMIADKGLQSTYAECGISEGEAVETVKLGKKNIGGAKTMNQYDVFTLE